MKFQSLILNPVYLELPVILNLMPSPWAYSGELSIRGLFANEMWGGGGGLFLGGLIFGGTYYWNFTVQLNSDITMYQGTGEITSFFQGIVINKSPI